MEQETEDEATPSDRELPSPSNSENLPSRPRRRALPDPGEGCVLEHGENLSREELVEQTGIDAIAHSEILNKPITPDDAADLEALEAKRMEMLATAKKFANTAMAMLEERREAKELMESFLKREREAVDSLQKAKKLREQWESMMGDAHMEADMIRRDAIAPRKITFATPSDQQRSQLQRKTCRRLRRF
jgi:hypothetical protein